MKLKAPERTLEGTTEREMQRMLETFFWQEQTGQSRDKDRRSEMVGTS